MCVRADLTQSGIAKELVIYFDRLGNLWRWEMAVWTASEP